MRVLSKGISILLIVVSLYWLSMVQAADFTSVITGDWNNGGTWGNASPGVEGVDWPGASDTAYIGSNAIVTITATQSVSTTTVQNNGSLVLNAGVTLKISTVSVSGITVDSGGLFKIEGSSTTHSAISRQESSGYIPFTVGGSIDAQYCNFNYLDSNGLNITTTGTISKLDHCKFSNVAQGGVHLQVATGEAPTLDGCSFDVSGSTDVIVDYDGVNPTTLTFTNYNRGNFNDVELNGSEVIWGAVTLYVDCNATGANNGNSWEDAYITIQQGVDDSDFIYSETDGSTVLVAGGTYNEQVSLNSTHSGASGKPNTIKAKTGEEPIINSSGAQSHCFYLDQATNYIIIDGFGCTEASSDGIYIYQSYNNIVQYCNIYKNTGKGINLYYDNYNHIIQYCNIYNNSDIGIYGYAHHGPGEHRIKGCSIYGNSSDGAKAGTCTRFIVKDSIIANNGGRGLYDSGGYGITDNYNDVFGNAINYYNVSPGAESISKNPGFVNPYNGDFRLYSNSPCVGAASSGLDMGACPEGPTVPVSSNTYYVAKTGLNTNPGTEGSPWLTIQKAADTMIAGDTVIVQPGTYSEDVSITKGGTPDSPITYQANSNVVVSGTNSCFSLSNVAGVKINGFELTGASYGFNLQYASDINIITCSIHDVFEDGIYLNRSSENIITNSSICSNSSEGIYLYKSGSNTIQYCNIYKNTSHGICYSNSRGNTIQYCNVYRNSSYGIYGDYSWNNKVKNCNICSNNSYGIYAYRDTSFTVKNSVIADNVTYGLQAYDSSSITDSYNDVYNNGTDYSGCSAGVGSISQDSLFVSTTTDHEDFHLQSNSPCIGTGEPNPTLQNCMGVYNVWNSLTNDWIDETTTHKIIFTTTESIPVDGKILITYPEGFGVSGVASQGVSSTLDGIFTVSVDNQIVLVTRSGGTPSIAGRTEDISIANVTNHSAVGEYAVIFETQDGSGVTIDGPVKSNNFAIKIDFPEAIIDLTASPSSIYGGSVELTWTAPHEDGSVGGAVSSYDVRYATSSFDEADWDASWVHQASGEPTPSSPGTTENMIVIGLTGGVTYYFAMKSQDEVPNISDISNISSAPASDNPETAPEVTLIAPNGGEIWEGTNDITWTYFDYNPLDTHTFKIELSADGGGNYPIILADGLPDGTTSYVWDTECRVGFNYKIKVTACDSSGLEGEGTSDGLFIINNPVTSSDGKVEVRVESGLPDDGILQIDLLSSVNSQEVLQGHQESRGNSLIKAISNIAYDIDISDWKGEPLNNLNMNAGISMAYMDVDNDGYFDGTYIDENYLRIFRLESDSRGYRWKLVEGNQTIDTVQNKISVEVKHFSIYSILAYASPSGVLGRVRNFPNPFEAGKEVTTIAYILTKEAKVTIRIYNLVGDLVREMEFAPGVEGGIGDEAGYNNRVEWDGRNGDGMLVANGAYICQVIAEPTDGSGPCKELRKIGVLK